MRSSSTSGEASLHIPSDPIDYHSFLAKSWSSRYQSRGFSRRLALFRYLLSTCCHPGTTWLDAGCGSGVLSRELVAFGAIGKGIDASPAMVELAASESKLNSQIFSFECVDGLEEIDVETSSLDGVLCSSVLEYVDSPSCVLAEFSRLLKPGGVLILSVPNKSSAIRRIQSSLRLIGRILGLNLFPYLCVSRHSFASSEVCLALSRLGISVTKMHSFDPVLPGWLFAFAPPSLLVFVAEKNRLV